MNEPNGKYDIHGNCVYQGDDRISIIREFDSKSRVTFLNIEEYDKTTYWESILYWDLETDDVKEYHNSKGINLFNHERNKSNATLAKNGNLRGFLIYL